MDNQNKKPCAYSENGQPIYLSKDPYAGLRGAFYAYENQYLQKRICNLV